MLNPIDHLPPWFAERTRAINCPVPLQQHRQSHEAFVLYWMHHAVRDHQNPALDVARLMADSLGLPLLVYQGLGGNHRYNSDRHHTFILEGARQVQRELRDQGISYALSLQSAASESSPLVSLAQGATLTISEEFPVPPFSGWVSALAARIRRPVWMVDTACIVPMQTVHLAFSRAFEFRRTLANQFQSRLRDQYPADLPARSRRFTGSLTFENTDLAQVNIADICAALDIDHSIGPSLDSVGGATAGYARWRQFLANDIEHYDKRRNDPVRFPSGVSRLSAYFHHGHISPFRVAHQTLQHRSSGARKFADELLIWRELAHNFCFHHASTGLESLDRLPVWARNTLAQHVGDRRPAHYHTEQLARAKTGDRLWDACQRSLLIHGELHNNVRMTWGKALLAWTSSPSQALDALIDLNHRYALDGGDPNSYGGLLWCLGLFDRPFKPEQPVYGTLRTRSPESHAKRLDIQAFEQNVSRYRGRAARRVVVIGAGISGLAAARTLHDNGMEVLVLDRGRHIGGRSSTNRAGFDYGAPYFSVTDPRFERSIQQWEAQGLVTRRMLKAACWRQSDVGLSIQTDHLQRTQYAGIPGMAAIAEHLANDLQVTCDTNVDRIKYLGGRWQALGSQDSLLATADALVIAMPVEQARRLVHERSALITPLADAHSAAQWVTMVSYSQPFELPIDLIHFQDHPILHSAWCESRKPKRDGVADWVLHSSPEWARVNTETQARSVAEQMSSAFSTAIGMPGSLTYLRAHRWRFARPTMPRAPLGVIWSAKEQAVLCGDWCLRGDVESAYLSGVAAAGRVIAADRERTMHARD